MTPTQTTAEFAYLIGERLGIICEGREPTEAERAQAAREADEILKGILEA